MYIIRNKYCQIEIFTIHFILTRLGLDHLVGTNLLKAYMHGFFVDLRLYQKAKAIADPFEYEEHRKKMVASKLEKERASRISLARPKRGPKVNASFAKRIQEGEEEDGEGEEEEYDSDDNRKNKKKKKKQVFVPDERFSKMFEEEDYQIDENSTEWKLHHPSEVQNTCYMRAICLYL